LILRFANVDFQSFSNRFLPKIAISIQFNFTYANGNSFSTFRVASSKRLIPVSNKYQSTSVAQLCSLTTSDVNYNYTHLSPTPAEQWAAIADSWKS